MNTSIFPSRTRSIPKEEIIGVDQLRPYQVRAVGECSYALSHDSLKTCLVAPPGAGKTRCAFHIAAMTGLTIDVRVPTRALVQQWQSRADSYFRKLTNNANISINISTYASKAPFSPSSLVILDEAHHLTANWGKQILQNITPDHKILGLTATPPYDKSGWDVFIDLVGKRPVEIDAPPLVRDRHLAPYIDLVWPVLARKDEASELFEAHERLQSLESKYRREMQAWAKQLLEEDLEQMTEARFTEESGLLVSLCRFENANQNDLPLDLPKDPEFYGPMTLEDRALLLWSFGENYPELRTAVRKTGFRALKKGLVLFEDVAFRSLASSHSRVRACIDILKEESKTRADGMRALILTDRDLEGDRLSARQVLKALTADEQTDKLDPILVTGSAFWVDDDLWPKISSQFPQLPWIEAEDHHEINVSQWPTDERVALATRFLTEGTTRCLIGTRHLLGEGWDCPAVNCIIDLTGISASITVNQIRGRALRLDPKDPAKVASLWEVLAVLPGVSGGERMLERLSEKHEHTLGVDDQGRIRAGVGRIDVALQGSVESVARQVDTILSRMKARVREPWDTAKRWALGKTYLDQKTWRIQTEAPDLKLIERRRPAKLPMTSSILEKSVFSLRRRTPGGWKSSAASFIASGGLSAVTGTWGAFVIVAGVGLSAYLFTQWLRGKPRYDAMIRALHRSLVEVEIISSPLISEDGQFWVDGDPQDSQLFAKAAKELLGPIAYPRYLLIDDQKNVWAVPHMLGVNKDIATRFVDTWRLEVGRCEILFARRGAGRERIKEVWAQGRRPEVGVIETWV